MNESYPEPLPRIVHGTEITPYIDIDPTQVASVLHELGVSDSAIESTTIYLDGNSHIATNGMAYPNALGRTRFRHVPELKNAPGAIVRIGTNQRGKVRTEEDMNRTLVHELEHVAQMERKDKKMTAGHLAIWGLAAAGAVAGNKLAKKRGTGRAGRFGAMIAGMAAGQQIGYKFAPHEHKARERAKEITTSAISRKN